MKKVLVTGGAGFVGTNLIIRLLKEGHEVVSIDNYSTGKKENEQKGCKYFKVDICDYKSFDDFPENSRASLRGGFYADRVTKKGIEVGVIFSQLAKEIGLTAAQLAILWVKDQEGIAAPLIGPRTLTHLENLLPVADMKLSDDIRIACDKLVPPGSVIANFHNTAEWMKTNIDWKIK